MPTYGPVSPNESWEANPGTFSWSGNSSYLNSAEGAAWTASSSENALSFKHLHGRGFAPSVTSGETVNGILVEWYKKASEDGASRYVTDSSVKLGKGAAWFNTTLVGSNYADGSTKWPTSYAYASYGGASDLWGTTWTVSEVNSNLAAALQPLHNISPSPGSNLFVYADHVRVTIYTTAAGGGVRARSPSIPPAMLCF